MPLYNFISIALSCQVWSIGQSSGQWSHNVKSKVEARFVLRDERRGEKMEAHSLRAKQIAVELVLLRTCPTVRIFLFLIEVDLANGRRWLRTLHPD